MKVAACNSILKSANDSGPDSTRSCLGGSEGSLGVTVVFTTSERTKAALQLASRLAKDLDSRITLVAPEIVPFQFPLDRPPVAVDFLEQRLYDLVCAADIQEGEVVIQLFLCRDEYACLRRVLNPHSLVVIGQRKGWFGRASRLECFLKGLGHQVIAAPVRTRKGVRRYWESFWSRVLNNFAAGRPEICGSSSSGLPETQSSANRNCLTTTPKSGARPFDIRWWVAARSRGLEPRDAHHRPADK